VASDSLVNVYEDVVIDPDYVPVKKVLTLRATKYSLVEHQDFANAVCQREE
jgi:hypothetical protein